MLAELASQAMDVHTYRCVQHHVEIGGLVEHLLRDLYFLGHSARERTLKKKIEKADEWLGSTQVAAVADAGSFRRQTVPIGAIVGFHSVSQSVCGGGQREIMLLLPLP